jgi:hypothetical protein
MPMGVANKQQATSPQSHPAAPAFRDDDVIFRMPKVLRPRPPETGNVLSTFGRVAARVHLARRVFSAQFAPVRLRRPERRYARSRLRSWSRSHKTPGHGALLLECLLLRQCPFPSNHFRHGYIKTLRRGRFEVLRPNQVCEFRSVGARFCAGL